jgi:hypothetical protein
MTKYQRSAIKTFVNNIKSKTSELNGINSFIKDKDFESYTVRLIQQVLLEVQNITRQLQDSDNKYNPVIANIYELKIILDEIEKPLQEEF